MKPHARVSVIFSLFLQLFCIGKISHLQHKGYFLIAHKLYIYSFLEIKSNRYIHAYMSLHDLGIAKTKLKENIFS